MLQEDLKYLVSNLANLCGIPTRLYQNNNLISFVSFAKFPVDPLTVYENTRLPVKDNVGYFPTQDFF